jgi:hypothetical protein
MYGVLHTHEKAPTALGPDMDLGRAAARVWVRVALTHGWVRVAQALAAAFGYSEQLLDGFSASTADYGAVADRLLSRREVTEEDSAAVVQRVKELVTQVHLPACLPAC